MKSQTSLAPDAPEAQAKPTREQVAARNAELEAELAQTRAERDQLSARVAQADAEREQVAKDETVIKEKMDRGLTREQAKAVIARQREHGATRQTTYDDRRAAEIAARQKRTL